MKEWIFIFAFLGFFLLFTITSWDYPFVSALYPRLLLVCGFILSGMKIFTLLRRKEGQKESEDISVKPESSLDPKRMWIYLGSGVLYIILMPTLGFILSSLITLILLFSLLRIKLGTAVGVAVGTSFSLYLIFVLALGIPLPKGFVEKILF